jgi:hypothetical protein
MRKLYILLSATCLLAFAGVRAQNVTFSNTIANILYSNCTTCHRQGGLGPFPLQSYNDAYAQRFAIMSDVGAHIMPPWPPDTKYSHFSHERVLSETQISQIKDWVQNDAPEGDVNAEPKPPVFTNNSQLQHIDQTITIPTYTVTSTKDDYRCFAIHSGLTAGKFVTGIEPMPANHKIVHHILIYYDPSGQCMKLDQADPKPGYVGFGGVGSDNAKLVGAWVPGSQPILFPQGMGVSLPKGGDYVLQIHYAPGSEGQSDSTSVNFQYSTTNNLRQVYLDPVLNHVTDMTNGPISIPAGATKEYHEAYKSPYDGSLLAVAPHMHLIGRNIRAYAIGPDKDTIPLIRINNWDFHWQGLYFFPKLIHLKAGSTLYSDAFYDNTTANPNNPNTPPKAISAGESTTDEMMITYFAYLAYQPGDENLVLDSSALHNSGIPVSANIAENYNIYPNPANRQLNVTFYLDKVTEGSIRLYDMQGRMLKTLTPAAQMQEGRQQFSFDISGLQEGQYLCRLQTKQGALTKKLSVIY